MTSLIKQEAITTENSDLNKFEVARKIEESVETEEYQRFRQLVPQKEDRDKLGKIFSIAGEHGEHLVKEALNRDKFRRFIQNCRLIGEPITKALIDIEFSKATKGFSQMNFAQFVEALSALARKKYVMTAEMETMAIGRLLDEYVFANIAIDVLPWWMQPENSESRATEILDLFDIYRKPLGKLFTMYATLETPKTEELSYEELQRANNEISLPELFSFAKDYKLPQFTKADLSKLFRAANLSPSSGTQLSGLNYEEFLDFLSRCALGLYSKPPNEFEMNAQKVQTLFDVLDPTYKVQFKTSMHAELSAPSDKTNITPTATNVSPNQCGPEGGITVTISGTNFDESRIVVVRFGNIEVPSFGVKSFEVKAKVPPHEPTRTIVEEPLFGGESGKTMAIDISRTGEVPIFVSNDGKKFSQRQDVKLTYVESLHRVELEPPIRNELRVRFCEHCRFNDPYNAEHMFADKWRMFLQNFEMDQGLEEEFMEAVFLEHAAMHEGADNFSLVFKDFLRSLILLYERKLPTIDDFVETVQETLDSHKELNLRKTAKRIDTDTSLILQEVESLELQHARSFDIYSGPVLSATVVDKPGLIMPLKNPALRGKRHKFLHYTQHDVNTEDAILAHANIAESFDHFVARLLDAGFEVSASRDPNTRKPVGRCWTILDDKRKVVGSMWDYEGQICNLRWQPRQGELDSPLCTLMVYTQKSQDKTFLELFSLYKSHARTSLEGFRTVLEQRGFILKTKLYSPF